MEVREEGMEVQEETVFCLHYPFFFKTKIRIKNVKEKGVKKGAKIYTRKRARQKEGPI